jgi:putative glutamine amidotransferase
MGKPIIGINCDLDDTGAGRPRKVPYLYLYADYFDAILRAGGIAILIPFLKSREDVEQTLDCVEGLMLTGGAEDLDPAFYGQAVHRETRVMPNRRMDFDLLLARTALARSMPILAICQGMQLLNIVSGGTMMQHLPDEAAELAGHRDFDRADRAVHQVTVKGNSLLARIVGNDPLGVNSTHHQAVRQVGEGLVVSARSEDGIVEAVECESERFLLGVQWHPERLVDDRRNQRLFSAIVDYARGGGG